MADWLSSIAGGLLEGAFGLAGGAMNSQAIKEANRNSLAYSDYFNKNKIQMAVADAKKAGISPYAVVGGATGSMSPTFTANTAQGDALGKVGDALQNALVNATFQEIDDNSKMKELEIQEKELEIQEKKAQIAKMNNQNAFGSEMAAVAEVGLPSPEGGGIPIKSNKGFRTGEVFNIGKGLQLQKTLSDEWLITPDPESVQGQMVSEGYLNQAYSWIDTKRDLDHGGFQKIVNDLKKAGKIGKNQTAEYYWTPYGYRIRIKDKK